jgi:hypothetical protein
MFYFFERSPAGMLKKRKPRIGMLGIMHGLHDEKQPEISQKQDTANTILRSGFKFTVVTDAAYFRKIGSKVNHESIGDVFRYVEPVTEKEVNEQISQDGKNIEVDPGITEDSHRHAARLQLGFEKLLVDKEYDGFSAHFDVFKEDGRFKQLPILGASNLLAKGYGYAAEGDTNMVSMTSAGHVLIKDPHFTEMYSFDFVKDSALMSHMGEGNCKIARKDRPVKLIYREFERTAPERRNAPSDSVSRRLNSIICHAQRASRY